MLKSVGGRTPLHCAAFYGRHEVCSLFLERGANIHGQDKEGKTPLELALDFDNYALCTILVQK